MLISHAHKFIYFGPPRTGSTSICKLFKEHFVGEYCYRPEIDHNPSRFMSDKGRAQHQIFLPPESSDYLTILSVRNPYTRFRSMYPYFGLRRGHQSWEDYFPFALPSISSEIIGIRIDRVIRLEAIAADIHSLPFITSFHTIPHERKSKDLEALPTNAVAFVKEFYGDDFDRFGYSTYI